MSSTISRSDESDVAVGIALPQYGTVASPEAILRVAVEAEKMGVASLWVSDRLLLPTRPKETFDGDPWPEIFATVYDAIEMLTFAAARTRKVKALYGNGPCMSAGMTSSAANDFSHHHHPTACTEGTEWAES